MLGNEVLPADTFSLQAGGCQKNNEASRALLRQKRLSNRLSISSQGPDVGQQIAKFVVQSARLLACAGFFAYDRIVIGLTYSNSKKLAEQGGFPHDDPNVIILLSIPSLQPPALAAFGSASFSTKPPHLIPLAAMTDLDRISCFRVLPAEPFSLLRQLKFPF